MKGCDAHPIVVLGLGCLVAVLVATVPSVATAGSTDNATVADGSETINATAAWEQGITGDNVTVAVVDGAFDADHPAIAGAVERTEQFGRPGEAMSQADAHGTRVAGAVTRIAPDVSLHLYAAGGPEEQAAAIRNASVGADVIALSRGPHTEAPLDGSGQVATAIDAVRANGTTVVAAAGNLGQNRIYYGEWRDSDGDGRHEFAPGEETLRADFGSTIYLQWDEWGSVDSDYDVHVYAPNGTEIANATADQRSTGRPVAVVSLFPPARVDIRIEGTDADPGDALTLRVDPGWRPTEYTDGDHSLVAFATARGAITVGGYDVSTDAMYTGSSHGPTVDGRRKPELVGPTNVSVGTGGRFIGTSAAAPEVAGVAALLEEADPGISPNRTEAILTRTATPITGTEPNNVSGYGLVDANAAVEMALPVESIDGTMPRDPDGDGNYEDLTGDGEITTADAQVLFDHMDQPVVTDHRAAFDYNDNGQVGFPDVNALFQGAV